MELLYSEVERIIQTALNEDIGLGDRTTDALVPPDVYGTAKLLAKAPGILCGIDVARQVFESVDASLEFETILPDGTLVEGNRNLIATVEGSLSSILTAERTALNLAQRMSGVASLARRYAEAVSGTNARVVDTRKTMPGLRMLDKYAIRVGGAWNHRFGLFDGILIKDNHIAAVGGVGRAVELARRNAPHTLRIEIEAKEMRQVTEALEAGADIILLDNMPLEMLAEAVRIIGGKAITEASGGVTLDTIRGIAGTGVDLISVGAMTHSAVALDISLDIEQADE